MKTIVYAVVALAALGSGPHATGQQAVVAPAPGAAEPAGPAPGYVRIPAGQPVEIEIAAQISSKTARIDGEFPIRLAAAITVNGVDLVPAGAVGVGQIVHAAKARALGKAGELILAVRRVSCGDTTVTLRSFHYNAQGKDQTGTIAAATIAAGLVATPLMFLSGGEVVVPPGTRAIAKVKDAVDVPALPPLAACPVAAVGAVAATS